MAGGDWDERASRPGRSWAGWRTRSSAYRAQVFVRDAFHRGIEPDQGAGKRARSPRHDCRALVCGEQLMATARASALTRQRRRTNKPRARSRTRAHLPNRGRSRVVELTCRHSRVSRVPREWGARPIGRRSCPHERARRVGGSAAGDRSLSGGPDRLAPTRRTTRQLLQPIRDPPSPNEGRHPLPWASAASMLVHEPEQKARR
jgi:hypothetical protein